MRKINLETYSVHIRDEKGEWVDLPYEMKDSVIELIFSRDLQLNGPAILERDKLAQKINDCPDGFILLEEAEWHQLTHALDVVTGLGRPDVELVHRVLEAPEVDVEEKNSKEVTEP